MNLALLRFALGNLNIFLDPEVIALCNDIVISVTPPQLLHAYIGFIRFMQNVADINGVFLTGSTVNNFYSLWSFFLRTAVATPTIIAFRSGCE